MFVIKRDGSHEDVMLDTITTRIKNLCYDLDMKFVDPVTIAIKVIEELYPGVSTSQLDNLAAQVSMKLSTTHYDYAILASRISISNLHKQTKTDFSSVIDDLYRLKDESSGRRMSLIADDVYQIVIDNAQRLNSAIVYDRDYCFDYYSLQTLYQSYLLRINNEIVERPQHMLMRVAIGIHKTDIEAAIETYDLMSKGLFIHSSSTLFNAGTPKSQMSSCFLLTMSQDSIEGIYDTLKRCANISKHCGGIGLNVHCIRATNSYIAGTNSYSNGLVPMLKVYDNSARFVEQGGNKRPGAIAIYLEPWHYDIMAFLSLKRSTGSEELRARNLSYALWIPDLFMKRVECNGVWSLMCPRECPGLEDCWGEEFEELYVKYENEKRFRKQIAAHELWFAIVNSQLATGSPYMLYKDHCNSKSNQQNLGTIKCSSVCTEIVQYSSPEEIASCSLASISLPCFIDKEEQKFNFTLLHQVVKIVTKNLNKIIDSNDYQLCEVSLSSKKHRAIGIGVQGLADTFIMLRFPFDSKEAKLLNIQIFETIYYGALEASCELAQIYGPYETYNGSPISKGQLQFDLWKRTPTNLWDWTYLKEKICKYGVRNSLLVAASPTFSTARILGNNPSFEPLSSNFFTKKILNNEVKFVNKYLMDDLYKRNLWNDELRKKIIFGDGSIQDIDEIPDDIKSLYKTVWDLPQKLIMDMAIDRGAFIDQSQSINIYMVEPTVTKITSMHFYVWRRGLKSGMYRLLTNGNSVPENEFMETRNECFKKTNKLPVREQNSSEPFVMCNDVQQI